MASSPSAARLTEGHRLAQARLGAQTVQLIRATWPLLDPEDLDGTLGRWLRVTVPIVRRQRRQSALLAGEYLRAFRATEVGLDSRFVPVVDVPEELEAVITSLTVTGPVSIKRAVARLVPLERALPTAEAGVAAAAMRHALNGGRAAIVETVKADRLALGHARATGDNPCSFCAMLASRGPVFKDDSFDRSDPRFTGSGQVKVHDSCSCSLEPVYHRDTGWPPGSERYRDLWQQAKAEEGDTVANFRRLVEGG